MAGVDRLATSGRAMEHVAPCERATLIANRYVVEAQIGRGGMAVVSRVFDPATGARVALKQLLVSGSATAQQRARTLFERECRTLTLLNHPRIVRVLDHGVDNDVPYYTMELLDGGDLRERAPLAWKEACTIGRDLCSALSLLHARRMVYRDLSVRNVRCTSDGMAKLIDFGAMAPMGSAEFVVCTPAVAAPEVVNLQALDGRSDLYALGSVLYQTLTGRAPYPASSFQMLPALWQQPIAPPSAYVAGIPDALDSLVLELLKLDPEQRPASAAEVSERLCAIAGVGHDEMLVASQAYLTTPDLVGRKAELQTLRRHFARLHEAREGAALMFLGAAGAGRSRMLDASVFLAKLEGITVLRVRGDDAAGRHPDVVERFAEQLLRNVPDATSYASDEVWPVLAHLMPRLQTLAPERVTGTVRAADVQSQALPALRTWLLAIADRHPLLVEVDDIERVDVETRNLIALLSERTGHHPLVVVVARCTDIETQCDALRLLESKCTSIEVHPLDAVEVRALLASIFGDVPHLSALSHRLYELASGYPRRLMQFAQHLVDQGVVRHQRGAWTLPESLTELRLPRSLAEAISAIVNGLSSSARTLAEAIALGGVDQRFDLADLLQLTLPNAASTASDALLANLTELTTASVLVAAGGTYRLAGREWLEPLGSRADPQRERVVHAQLSQIFARRGDGPRQAFHIVRAGRPLEAVDALAEFADRSCARTDPNPNEYQRFIEETPDNWRTIYSEVLALAVNHPRQRHVECAIGIRLAGILALASGPTDGQTDRHLEALANALAQDAGLGVLASEAERVFDPPTALKQLAWAIVAASGYVVNSMDFDSWFRLPSLAPVAPLSTALATVHAFAEGADARFAARFGQSRRIFMDLLATLPPPNDVSLAQTYANGIRVGSRTSVGLYAALLGDMDYERCAQDVSTVSVYTTNALLVRALGVLWQGDVLESDRLENLRRLRRLEHRRPQNYEGLSAVWRFMAYAACEDLTRMRLGLDEIERLASRSPTWDSTAIWARAEYERIRGDRATALAHVDDALSRMKPGRHILWSAVATTRLLILTGLGRQAEARRFGEHYLAEGKAAGLDVVQASLHLATALAAAKQVDAQTATYHVSCALKICDEHNAGGLRLGLAFEVAASVAIYLQDKQAFEHYAPLCRALYCAHDNRPLAAKYERLMRAATRAGIMAETVVLPTASDGSEPQNSVNPETSFATCTGPDGALESDGTR